MLSPVEVPCSTTVAKLVVPIMAMGAVLLKISVAWLATPVARTLFP